MRKYSIALLLFFFTSPVLAANTCATTLTEKIEALRVKHNIPGASVAVVKNGSVVWAKGFGDADLATNRHVTTDTLFQACSITKTLTATAVMQVLSKYNISLDAPVNNYLKRWKIPENKFTQQHPVTIRTLLNHTAAISNPYPDGGYAYNAKLPTLTQTFKGEAPATNPPLHVTEVPGKKYQYCNGCFSILQMFLEDVTGELYPQLMQKQILKPLHMTNSYFDNNLFLQHPDKVALPYDANRKRYPEAPSANSIYSTGLLWTTPTDLAKFMIAMQNSFDTSHGFLKQNIALQLITPDSTPTRGLGFFLSNDKGDETANGKYFMHSGDNIGYLSEFLGSINGKTGSVIMINISPKWNATEFPQFQFIKDTLPEIDNYINCSK